MQKVSIIGKDYSVEYFIEGEIPVEGDFLKLQGYGWVKVTRRIIDLQNSRVENGKRIRESIVILEVN